MVGAGCSRVFASLAGGLLPDVPAKARQTSPRESQMLIRRLLTMVRLERRYALTISRAEGSHNVMCAFENKVDADLAAKAITATSVEPSANFIRAPRHRESEVQLLNG
jgi:hypothetical protein